MARILSFRTARARSPEAGAPHGAAPSRAAEQPQAPLTAQEVQRFRALLLPHLNAVYSFARFLARDATQAEDLVQEAFLKACRGFPGFRGGDPRAWLFAIVRSIFLTNLARPDRWAEADGVETLAAEADTPEAAVLRQSEVAMVRGAIEALPEPFREALVLRELEELSYRQIAEITQAPIGTVMSRLARARQMLLAALREGGAP